MWTSSKFMLNFLFFIALIAIFYALFLILVKAVTPKSKKKDFVEVTKSSNNQGKGSTYTAEVDLDEVVVQRK